MQATESKSGKETSERVRVGIYLPTKLHRKIKAECALKGVTVNDAITAVIEASFQAAKR